MSLLYRFKSFLSEDAIDEFTVKQVSINDYLLNDVYCRKEFLFIYGLPESNNQKNNFKFEIIFIKEDSKKNQIHFSLFRGKTIEETLSLFGLLADKLIILNKLCPKILNITTLQDISNYSRKFQKQSLVHICANFDYTDYFKADENLIYLNKKDLVCPETLLSPMCIAIKNKNIQLVNFFLKFDFIQDIIYTNKDAQGNNVFHLSAKTNEVIIDTLCLRFPLNIEEERFNFFKAKIKNLIKEGNKLNIKPLYVACSENKLDCVKALLKNGANVNDVCKNNTSSNINISHGIENDLSLLDQLDIKEIKNGGNPLHWVKDCKIIEKLIELGCDINQRNFKGNTPLHTVILKKNFVVFMYFLYHGANIEECDFNGETPLHLAVRLNYILYVQTLIVYDANVNCKNLKGETPRHICATNKNENQSDLLYILNTVDAERCKNFLNCKDGCAQNGFYNGKIDDTPFHQIFHTYDKELFKDIIINKIQKKKNKLHEMEKSMDVNNENKTTRVLCLDGGGIRGLIFLQMLIFIEKYLGKKTYELFDFISGTSTGCISALAFGIGKSAYECRNIYFKLKDEIFNGIRPYETANYENFLKIYFKEKTIDDIKNIKVMIPVTKADKFPVSCIFFRNYPSPNEILNKPEEDISDKQYLWYIARASSAAPSYFNPCDNYIDGGLVSNNPTIDTLTEIIYLNNAYKLNGQVDKIMDLSTVVSLGTGLNSTTSIDPLKFGYSSFFENVNSIKILKDILIEQSTQTNGQVIKRCNAWCYSMNVPFFRLNPPISINVNLNETDNQKLIKILWETTVYMYTKKEEILKLKDLLI